MKYTVSIKDYLGNWQPVDEYEARDAAEAERLCRAACAMDYAECPQYFVAPEELGEMLVEEVEE